MGARYFLTVICPECGTEEEDVYYAPTCDFVSHTCSGCGTGIDLEKYTGITYEDASNIAEIEAVILALTPKEAEYIDGRKMSCDEINRASGVFL